jgi:hypothetical protein
LVREKRQRAAPADHPGGWPPVLQLAVGSAAGLAAFIAWVFWRAFLP